VTRFVVYADGAARGNPGAAGAGAVLLDQDGRVVAELTRALGRATNNVAEYNGLILGLEEAQRRGADAVDVRMDSMLVVQQMRGVWRVKHPGLQPLARRARELLLSFPEREIRYIPREENLLADAMSNRAIDEAVEGASRRGPPPPRPPAPDPHR
jgi:probable phosphoglycerate mutase